MSENVKIVPATCSQCGGTVEVDPNSTEARCPFCGTTFVVDKAINNYNIQHASIGHADNVNIDMTGSVKSVLSFVGEQMRESREVRREIRKAEVENSRMINQGFLKIFGLMCAGMMIIAVIMMIFYQITAEAADSRHNYVDDATFYGAIHGQTADGKELVLAFYDKKGNDVVYVNDGISHVYSSFKKADSSLKGYGNVEKYTIGDTFVVNFCDHNGTPLLITDDGIVFSCEYLTADDVATLISYD